MTNNNLSINNNNNILQNNLAKYFLNEIDSFIIKKQAFNEFLEVVNSDIPLYNLIKSNHNYNYNHNYNCNCDSNCNCNYNNNNITFDICNYSSTILKLLNKETIIKYSENFYKEAYNNIMMSDYITSLEVKNYFLYNSIKNIARSEASSNVLNEIYKEDIFHNSFLYENYINYIQIHKTSPTPLSKELFLKLFNRPAYISFYIKNRYINKEIINPDTLTILEIIAYQDKVVYKCEKMISKKTKNFCKIINKEDLYDLIFN